MGDAPTQSDSPEKEETSLFSFGPATKKRRISPEEQHKQSITEEFLKFYELASKKRRNFADFWLAYKKVILVILLNFNNLVLI